MEPRRWHTKPSRPRSTRMGRLMSLRMNNSSSPAGQSAVDRPLLLLPVLFGVPGMPLWQGGAQGSPKTGKEKTSRDLTPSGTDQVERDLRYTDPGWRTAPSYRRQGMLTHKVTDSSQLPILLHAHITPIAGFKCHPPAVPFYFKHGVSRAVGRGRSQRERGAEFGLPSRPWVQGGTEACPPQKYPLPVGLTPHPSEHSLLVGLPFSQLRLCSGVLVEVITKVTAATKYGGTNF